MILTPENYFSLEANKTYMSNSQFKEFVECEAKAMAKLSGELTQEDGTHFLIGKYVHAWNEGELDEFKKENPEIFKKDGDLKSEFKQADLIIEAIQKDSLFLKALSGQKEQIFTAELFGCEWKIVIDSLFLESKRFGDLKVLKSLDDKFWDTKLNCYLSVFEHRGYFTQMAIYAEVLKAALKEKEYYEPFLAVITKDGDYPDKSIISFVSNIEPLDEFIATQLAFVEQRMPRILEVKEGQVEPSRCEKCTYCRQTKLLKGTTHYSYYQLGGY